MDKEKSKAEEKKIQVKKELVKQDPGGNIEMPDGEAPCPNTHENIIICTECPGEPRFCALCICAHRFKKHKGGLKHLKEKIIERKAELNERRKESQKVSKQYEDANKSIIECFDGAQEKKKKALDKTSEIQQQLEKRKSQICGGLLEIQGKASIVVHKLRTSLGDSKLSTEKIDGLTKMIDSVQNPSEQIKVNYRELYDEVEDCLKPPSDDVEKEIKNVTDKVHGWYEKMEILTEEIDLDLISKKDIRVMNKEKEDLAKQISTQLNKNEKLTQEFSTQIKTLQEEIKSWKKKNEDCENEITLRNNTINTKIGEIENQKKEIEKLNDNIKTINNNLATAIANLNKEKVKNTELEKFKAEKLEEQRQLEEEHNRQVQDQQRRKLEEEQKRRDEEEQKRKEEEEKKRKLEEAENKRKLEEAEKKRKLEEAENKRKLEEAENKRKLEEAENKRKLEEAENKRKLEEAEKKRKSEEEEKKKKSEEEEKNNPESIRKRVYDELCGIMGSEPSLIKLRDEVKVLPKYDKNYGGKVIPLKEVAAIAAGLVYSDNITYFGLACDEGIKLIAKAIGANYKLDKLNLLGLEGNEIKLDGAKALAEAFKINKNLKLKELYLIYNYIPDEGALAICDALENRKQHLTVFYMGNNKISEAVKSQIKERFKCVEDLDL